MGLFFGNSKRKEEKALEQREQEWGWRKESANQILAEKVASFKNKEEQGVFRDIFNSNMSSVVSEDLEAFVADFSQIRDTYARSLDSLFEISANNCVFYQTDEEWAVLASKGEDERQRQIDLDMDRTTPLLVDFQLSACKLCLIQKYLLEYLEKAMYFVGGLIYKDDGNEKHQEMYNSTVNFIGKMFNLLVVEPCWKQWKHQNPVSGSFSDDFLTLLQEKDRDRFYQEASKYAVDWMNTYIEVETSFITEHQHINHELTMFWKEIEKKHPNPYFLVSHYIFYTSKSAITEDENWKDKEEHDLFFKCVNIIYRTLNQE